MSLPHKQPGTEEEQRGELFDQKPQTAAERARARRDRSRSGAYRIGEGLAGVFLPLFSNMEGSRRGSARAATLIE